MYLACRERDRTAQICVPKEWEHHVRLWAKRCREVRELLKKVSGLYEAKVRRRRD